MIRFSRVIWSLFRTSKQLFRTLDRIITALYYQVGYIGSLVERLKMLEGHLGGLFFLGGGGVEIF